MKQLLVVEFFLIVRRPLPTTNTVKDETIEETAKVQGSYTSLIEHLIKTVRAPNYTELGTTLGLKPEDALKVMRRAAESALANWFVHETDYVEAWTPFSIVPTRHLVTIDGEQRWYGQ